VITVVRDSLARQQPADEADRFLKPVGSDPACFERQAHHVVLVLEPTGADAEFESAVGQPVKLRGLLGKQGWMPEVVAVHAAAKP
jgi:hypothetical protein